MKPTRVLMGLTIAGLCASVRAQQTTDTRELEVSPAAAPRPALLYQLTYDDIADRRPGNAAILYMDAILLMGPDSKENAQKAMDAYNAKDQATFAELVVGFANSPVYSELDLAGRRMECDWQPPFQEKGADTLLPHLGHIAQGLRRMVEAKALREVQQGKNADAIQTLRLGYEMAGKLGHGEPVLISGLVATAVQRAMNGVLVELIQRPDAPNLYWALGELPSDITILRHAFEGERQGWTTAMPSMVRVRNGEQISGEQWREIFAYIQHIQAAANSSVKSPDPVDAASAEVLAEARKAFVSRRHVAADQAAKVDPAVVLGEYYFEQYVPLLDDMYKLRGLPYPEWLSHTQAFDAMVPKWKADQPTNPFMTALPAVHKAVLRVAQADREIAALKLVEALRGYAAGHGGKLPAKLEELEEMPAPPNPMTAEAFEYSVSGGVATIGDSASEVPLVYTVKIRK